MTAIKMEPIREVKLEYLLVCKDGSRGRGPSLEIAHERVRRVTHSTVMMSLRIHPDTIVTGNGYIKYPDGYPPEEIDIKKGKEWIVAD